MKRPPESSPPEVLCELTRRLGLGYSRSFIFARVERHPAPSSLFALVEVARALGLTLSASRCEPDVLDDIEASDLPVILHFGGETGGFGLLVQLDAPGFRVWDAANGERVFDRDELAPLWSGVLVLVERSKTPGEIERARPLRRLQELLFLEWKAHVELTGPRASPLVRALLYTAFLALSAAAALTQPPESRVTVAALAALSAVGLAATFSMARVVHGESSLPAALCGSGGPLDCKSVLTSAYSRLGGIHFSDLGLAFFGASSLTLIVGAATPERTAAALWLVGGAFLLAAASATFFLWAQLRLGRFCVLCAVVHAVDLLGAAAFIAWAARRAGPLPAAPHLALSAVAFALFFGLLLGSTAPHLHQAPDLDRAEKRLDRLLALPAVTLAELIATSPVELDGATLGIPVGDPAAPLVVTVFAHPLCPACGEVLVGLEELLRAHAGRARGHVIIAPLRGSLPGDRALCGALVGIGSSLETAALFALVRAVKGLGDRLTRGDPLPVLSEALALDRDALTDLAASAAPRVERAAAAASLHTEGVPTIFVNRRRCLAPIAHVAAWCDDPTSWACIERDLGP